MLLSKQERSKRLFEKKCHKGVTKKIRPVLCIFLCVLLPAWSYVSPILFIFLLWKEYDLCGYFFHASMSFMKVFKFGGASLENAERIRNVGNILKSFPDEPLLVVISAMGKTTNELEKVAENYFRRKREIAAQLLHNIRQQHWEVAVELLGTEDDSLFDEYRQFFAETEWILGNKPYHAYDYYYDQIVSLGEMLSSLLLSAYLKKEKCLNKWVDVRDIIRTDDTYRDGNIDWEFTQQQVTRRVEPLFSETSLIITQGFIGATAENNTTTLGREGSDYTAAVFTNMLNAESLSIWKDVDGLKNADPKLFEDTVNIAEINYREVIEMAYYGAQVIHPKTIKPLQNKKIPLYVKCFLNKDLPGTLIHEDADIRNLPPIIVLKQNQMLLTLGSRDFSFVTEDKLSDIYDIFHALKIKINLMQNGAISFSCCIEHNAEKIESLIKKLHQDFTVSYDEGLQLLTVRHYQPELVERLAGDKAVLLEQRSGQTVQIVLKS